jgi:hypothetical protein
VTRSKWRELDAATKPPAPRRPSDDTEERTVDAAGDKVVVDGVTGDGPVDGWTDTDEYLIEP